jgi:ABC-2 type transport system permease protein
MPAPSPAATARAVLAIARREVDAYFATPLGWLALCGFVVITGFFFVVSIVEFNDYAVQAAYNPYMAEQLTVDDVLLPMVFGNWAVVLLLMCPAVSMRIFSEDLRQRSFELLLASPVFSGAIVGGKYLGALGFMAVLFASTLYQPAVLYWLGAPDPGVIAGNYLAMFLLSACCLAVGMLASAFTDSQIVAFMVAFASLLVLYLLGWVGELSSAAAMESLAQVSMLSHLDQLMKGLLHSEDLVYFLTFVGFFLFATQQRVESFRWR